MQKEVSVLCLKSPNSESMQVQEIWIFADSNVADWRLPEASEYQSLFTAGFSIGSNSCQPEGQNSTGTDIAALTGSVMILQDLFMDHLLKQNRDAQCESGLTSL